MGSETTSKPPQLSTDEIVDLGGWALLKQARQLVEADAIKGVEWDPPVLKGSVGAGRASFHPRLNLRSLTFAENTCNCSEGRQGFICAHAIALCVAAANQAEDAEREQAKTQEDAGGPVVTLKSLTVSPTGGTPLGLRVLLPPNLSVTAKRDAIVVKLELDVDGKPVAPEKADAKAAYLPTPQVYLALTKIEQWSGGSLGSLMQLSRRHLRELVEPLRGMPHFYWINAPREPILWKDGKLTGVEEHLRNPKPPAENAAAENGSRSRRDKPGRTREATPGSLSNERAPAGPAMKVDGSSQFLAITLPGRDHPLYDRALELVKMTGFKLKPSNRTWWLRDRHKTLNFLADHWDELKEVFGAKFTDSFKQRTKRLKQAEVRATAQEMEDQFSLELKVEAGRAGEDDLRQALASSRSYVESGKDIYLCQPGKIEQAERLQRALSGDSAKTFSPNYRAKISVAALNDAEDLLDEFTDQFELPETWTQRSAALKSVAKLKPAPIPERLDTTLRNYQRIGVAWLWHLYESKLGGILADEMGLGKTLQALGLLSCAVERDGGPTLVVCPASLLENWRREALRFAPWLKIFVHHGSSRIKECAELASHDCVVTSYGTLIRDSELFRQAELTVVIADEAQHIKNRRSQNARALRSLKARGRFLLTGTPVENSLDDLRSLFEFLMPGYFAPMPAGVRSEERAWYDARHRKQAAPYILRRGKKLVAPELPEKIEQTVYCEFGGKQSKLYKKVHEESQRAIFELEMAGASENRTRMAALTQLLRLRQVCAEPRLLDDKLKPKDSAKMEAFLEILDEALDGDHRLLVFSQFTSVLASLRETLEARGCAYCYLDGSTKNRQAVCDRFNSDGGIPVFLISLKAGGTGLNLTGADTVVHFDPWWNPAVEAQATDRAHRIGQTRKVTSIRLIASNTVEEKVSELQREKAELLRDLLDESSHATAKVGLKDMKEILEMEQAAD